jgi:hypothetical protein
MKFKRFSTGKKIVKYKGGRPQIDLVKQFRCLEGKWL